MRRIRRDIKLGTWNVRSLYRARDPKAAARELARWKRPLGRPRRRWVDNIRMDLQEVGCVHVDWIGLAQDRDGWRKPVSVVMNFRVP